MGGRERTVDDGDRKTIFRSSAPILSQNYTQDATYVSQNTHECSQDEVLWQSLTDILAGSHLKIDPDGTEFY